MVDVDFQDLEVKTFGKEIDVDVQILGHVALLESVCQAMLTLSETSFNDLNGMVIPI